MANRLERLQEAWAVAGGWAIDLFADAAPRKHDDLEVVTSRDGLDLIQAALPELEWYAAHDGTLTSISATPAILDEAWQTWGWDAHAKAWRVDVMCEPWDSERWIYRRNPTISMPLSAAIHTSASGIPFLAPEIVRLFKAKHSRSKDERDLRIVLPLMSERQTKWLTNALELERPDHAWLPELQS